MKNSVHKTQNAALPNAPIADALHKKVIAAEKSVQKARADYEQKSAAYEAGLKQESDKPTLRSLKAAAKIAKLTLKIRRTEHKLAKSNWKASEKLDKKSAVQAGKAVAKALSGKGHPKKDAPAPAKAAKKKRAAQA